MSSCIDLMDFNHVTTLILGGRGLIGSACHRKYPKALAPSREELNLFQRDRVFAYFRKAKPRHVILAAGMVGGIEYNRTFPANFILNNLKIQLNVFEAAEAAQVERLIFFGSSCIYPKNAPQPMKESYFLTGVPELTSLSYSIAKIAGVQMARAMNEQSQTNRFVVLIPNTVYGPNDDFNPKTAHVVSSMLVKFHQAKERKEKTVSLWGTGNPKREFVYVDDVVAGVDLAFRLASVPIPLNLGSGEEISMRDLAVLIARVVGFQGECHWESNKPDGALQKLLDSSNAFSLGFRPFTTLQEGLSKTYASYLSKLRTEDLVMK